MSDSMTAALEPVPNHGTSSTNTHPGSLSPVVTGRQNTELATPDTNMDSTVTMATVADTLPPRNNEQREGSLTQKENMVWKLYFLMVVMVTCTLLHGSMMSERRGHYILQ